MYCLFVCGVDGKESSSIQCNNELNIKAIWTIRSDTFIHSKYLLLKMALKMWLNVSKVTGVGRLSFAKSKLFQIQSHGQFWDFTYCGIFNNFAKLLGAILCWNWLLNCYCTAILCPDSQSLSWILWNLRWYQGR